jgi:hypothetical protein
MDIIITPTVQPGIVVEITESEVTNVIDTSDSIRTMPRISVQPTEPQNPIKGDIWFKTI